MKKFVFLTVLAVSILSFSACSSKKDNISSKVSNASQSSSQPSTTSSSQEQSPSIKETFDSIAIGDITVDGQGGTLKDEVVKMYGNPSFTSNTNVGGKTVEQLTWNFTGSAAGLTISMQFINNNATSKQYAGANWPRTESVTLSQFNSLADGTSFTDAVAKFGEPNGLAISYAGGQKSTVASYTTGVKGNTGANFVLQFTNDTLSSKSQAGLSD